VATQTFTRLVDDLDGSKAERTVEFSWDGKSYAIDLSKKNLAALEKTLRPYLDAARSQRRPTNARAGTGRQARSSSIDLAAVRQWARDNGYSVSDRGRVSREVLAGYEASRDAS
jgi:nucleoid-associated protein Lsr2